MKTNKTKPMIIAMDGPAGSGKSTTARMVAERLKLPYLDTGAMYRAVTLVAIEKKIPLTAEAKVAALAAKIPLRFGKLKAGEQSVWLGRRNISRDIRTPELTAQVHHAASSGAVRSKLVLLQRRTAQIGGGVIEGRDIGTVVFPDTPYKYYLDADVRLRSRRRYRELKAKGLKATFAQILKDQKERDYRDANRKIAPLRKADDATLIDTTKLTISQTADIICDLILGQKPRLKSGRN
jgi:cytidylate kinase